MAIFPPLHHLQSVIPLPTPHPLLSRPVLSVVLSNRVANPEISGFQRYSLFVPQKSIIFPLFRAKKINASSLRCFHKESQKSLLVTSTVKEKMVKKMGKPEHHVWQKRDSAGSGHKALSLLSILRDLPNEKEAVYGALDKWTAWETEFPLVAASKALKILRRQRQWTRVIQVSKWMLSKGQGATMGTYGTLLLAFDMDQRVDEAESLWNMILHTHTRSLSKQLFSRMISLYDHHDMPDKIIEVFADMEELGVRPDEDTVRRVARGFQKLGQEEKQKMVLKRYLSKYKYVHFRGERVRVKRYGWEQESMRKCFNG